VVGPPAAAAVDTESDGTVVKFVVGVALVVGVADVVTAVVVGVVVVVVVVVVLVVDVVVVVPVQMCENTTLSAPVITNSPPSRSSIVIPEGTVTYACWVSGYGR
jgi:hypothetical protein